MLYNIPFFLVIIAINMGTFLLINLKYKKWPLWLHVVFDRVYLIGRIEKILPHKSALSSDEQDDRSQSTEDAIEKERRLAYVGITRAKSELYLSSPKEYHNKESKF
ncbi:UvrD-like helicase family protein [Bacillus sp. V-88]|uniref:3'-5' exonuclease n=1 Tax=Rossellomorea vietnamensis TaxID=218284 RepID=UPI00054D4A6D|nr:3'-5' exonuclease [Rossellomorea vietnamensis]OXS58207.1 hypothetical protein B1B00_14770 [Bacillus sp. DSM 27956]PRX75314.1 UvrD-like helicase family protein [Bacillus sp. V-88]SLK23765.1 UvrD-like helicase C-terminal domain-containing protein [Bacillus sp. V-88]